MDLFESRQLWIWATVSIFLQISNASPSDSYDVKISMPAVHSSKPDDLICHSFKLNSSFHQYILEYIPQASREIAHHMMIYGCGEPGSHSTYWKCGGRERSESDVCADNSHASKRIVYAWALDAPQKSLPEGVGLRVGGDTDIQYVVLQLHYKRQFKTGEKDSSGVTLRMSNMSQPKQMGFYILGSWGYIPPGLRAFHLDSACLWNRNYTIYPFGYRTHSHNLGRVTSAYRIRDGVWTEIGRMSPQQPEMFYDITHPGLDIKYGDVIAARCTMNSQSRDGQTVIGVTNHDEMCNFYFMYSTEQRENLDDIYCFRDAQQFHWSSFLSDIPRSASSLDRVKLIRPEMEPDDHISM